MLNNSTYVLPITEDLFCYGVAPIDHLATFEILYPNMFDFTLKSVTVSKVGKTYKYDQVLESNILQYFKNDIWFRTKLNKYAKRILNPTERDKTSSILLFKRFAPWLKREIKDKMIKEFVVPGRVMYSNFKDNGNYPSQQIINDICVYAYRKNICSDIVKWFSKNIDNNIIRKVLIAERFKETQIPYLVLEGDDEIDDIMNGE